MSTSPVLLPHLPFFEALATLEESSSAWRAAAAGLVTLRLFEKWVEDSRRGMLLETAEVTSVWAAIDAVDAGDVGRNILHGIVRLASHPNARPSAALAALTAYARSLQFDAQWALAADAYGTVVRHGSTADPELATSASFLRGYCLRMTGALDEAAASYEVGQALAMACGDVAGVLQADVSQANLSLDRGNLPRAEALLDRVIAQAEGMAAAPAISDVLSRALHDRGTVAARRAQFDAAAAFGHRALALCTEPARRDRILADIATALGDAGHYDAARDAHLVIAVTACEQSVRWVAMINLLHLAAWTGSEAMFERHRDELAELPLPPLFAAHYHLYVAEGCRRFGQPARAIASLTRAIDIAGEYGINEVLLRAEAALRDAERQSTAATSPTRAAGAAPIQSPEIAEVIRAIGLMREMAAGS